VTELYLICKDFFGEQANRELYELALCKNENFSASRTSYSKHYPEWRKSKVIYHNEFERFRQKMEQAVRRRLPEVLSHLKVDAFDIEGLEIQLTSHNDGEYYKWHTDNSSPDTANRIITFVYYFHSLPKAFSGGELVIYHRDKSYVIEPANDSIVFFHSGRRHEVKPVDCPTKLFEHGRFTLNGWVRCKRTRNAFDHQPAGDFSSLISQQVSAGLQMAASKPANGTNGTNGHAQLEHRVKHLEEKVQKMESLLDLYSELYHKSGAAGSIPVEYNISGEKFFQQYYYLNRPVILKGMMDHWPALHKWSPAYFAEHFGDVNIEVTAGRNKDPEYEKNYKQTLRTCTLRQFIERMQQTPDTNDLYIVARNYFFANPAFDPLRDDLKPPPEIVDVSHRSAGATKLWLGPKGTVTPLHHDRHSILFTQIHGSKQFKMIPSFELNKMYNRDKYYSHVDADNVDAARFPRFLEASVADVVVHPGDMLLIPAGWFHWVKSLDVSISVTFSAFAIEGRNSQWNCL
jgi:Rps23 Pro-64 3,4-dihydroxylase Tpa1-like proline 4-hydroxylase